VDETVSASEKPAEAAADLPAVVIYQPAKTPAEAAEALEKGYGVVAEWAERAGGRWRLTEHICGGACEGVEVRARPEAAVRVERGSYTVELAPGERAVVAYTVHSGGRFAYGWLMLYEAQNDGLYLRGWGVDKWTDAFKGLQKAVDAWRALREAGVEGWEEVFKTWAMPLEKMGVPVEDVVRGRVPPEAFSGALKI
jgi:hypothetical protein